MTPAEIEQIRANAGYIVCPSSDPKKFCQATGSLVVTNQEVVTAKHVYATIAAAQGPAPNCFFQNTLDRYQRATLDFSPGNFVLGPGADPRDDWIVIRLKTPIEGAVPLPIIN